MTDTVAAKPYLIGCPSRVMITAVENAIGMPSSNFNRFCFINLTIMFWLWIKQ